MKPITPYLFALLALGGCHHIQSDRASTRHDDGAFARTTLEPRSGSKAHGEVVFSRRGENLEIVISVKETSPGEHGIHLHEKGDCSAKNASSAGDHFNPAHLDHGHPDPQQFHMGDLGNIKVNADGNGELKLVIPATRFHPEHRNWSVIIGKSVVLHQKHDDLSSQPSGDSGDRIACGVIDKAE